MTYEDTASFFDGTARLYDEWFLRDIHYMAMLASLVRRLRRYQPRHIVELGCGTGNLSVLLGERFPDARVSAVDISRDLLEQATAKCAQLPNVSLIEADMMSAVGRMPSGASVIANYSLHHLLDADKRGLVAQLGRVLAPGSVVLIGDVFYPLSPPIDESERRRAGAVLDLFHARAHYYLEVVGVERCTFEVEHLPLVLQHQREHLVEQGFWSRLATPHGLTVVADDPVGPPDLGNYIVELTRDAG